jgi:uncharacterized protein
MIRLTEIAFGSATPIDGYGPGFFRVGGAVLEGAVIVTENGARGWAGLDDLAPLLALADEVDVILIGTGAALEPLSAEVRAALEAGGLAADPMASATAARSYNMLLAEGRRVAAALLPLP